MIKLTKHGHPKFYILLNKLSELHDKKNKQYASKENPLGNFYRGSQIVKKFFHPDLQEDPDRLALAYALILATKQIDGAVEIIAENKTDTPDSLQEKLRDVMVYYAIGDCIEDDRINKE